jgi:hypothetical protein
MNTARRTLTATSIRRLAAAALAACALAGCNSRPPAIQIPQYDPQAFASSLLERFDADHNATLSKQEAAKAPGLAAAWSRYDTNKDEAISRDELAARAQQWVDRRDGMVAITCVVRLGSSQIADVQVKLVPDESLRGVTQPAEAVSLADRPSLLSIPPELKSEAHRNFSGMQYGLYQVAVSHPTMQLTARSTGCDIGVADQASPVVILVERSK